MSNFCANCGKELENGAEICSNCGKFVETYEPSKEVYKLKKVNGRGISIAGMILGIIACIWTLLAVMSLPTVGTVIDEMLDAYSKIASTSYILFWFGVGYTFFSFIPAFVGLPLSIAGFVKQKSGKNIAGLILNSVAILASIVIIVYITSYK